jgi:RNA recognition motif-containing protein
MDIYVGNLSRNTTEEGLRELFKAHGTINSVKIMVDKFTGEPRGFGFVAMPNDEEANAAIAALNGYELDGRSLRINQARPPEPREGGAPRSGGFNRPRGGNDRNDRFGGDRGGFRNNRY